MGGFLFSFLFFLFLFPNYDPISSSGFFDLRKNSAELKMAAAICSLNGNRKKGTLGYIHHTQGAHSDIHTDTFHLAHGL